VRALGVSLPGHFIVKLLGGGGELLVDPFHQGTLLSELDCQKRLDRIYGGKMTLRPEMLAACGPREMLARMLRNLKAIYLKASDHARALRVVDLLVAASPEAAEELRDRGLLFAAMDCYGFAARDLQEYLARAPESREVPALRVKLEELRRQAARLN
jgi:regulator of sirC expression with transglutaminase-like and TPR domain